jgi:hypothetical protein
MAPVPENPQPGLRVGPLAERWIRLRISASEE